MAPANPRKPSSHCGDDLRLGWQNVSSSSLWREKLRAFRVFVSLPIPTAKMLQNDHWIPQSVYLLHGCQFTWQRLDFVGLMTSDKWQMNLQVRAMLQKLGLSLDLACQLADQYFPIQGFASKYMERHANIHRNFGGSKGNIFRTFYGGKAGFTNSLIKIGPCILVKIRFGERSFRARIFLKLKTWKQPNSTIWWFHRYYSQ